MERNYKTLMMQCGHLQTVPNDPHWTTQGYCDDCSNAQGEYLASLIPEIEPSEVDTATLETYDRYRLKFDLPFEVNR